MIHALLQIHVYLSQLRCLDTFLLHCVLETGLGWIQISGNPQFDDGRSELVSKPNWAKTGIVSWKDPIRHDRVDRSTAG